MGAEGGGRRYTESCGLLVRRGGGGLWAGAGRAGAPRPSVGGWCGRGQSTPAAPGTKDSCAPDRTELDFLRVRAGKGPESVLTGFRYYRLLLQIEKTTYKVVARLL